MPRLAVVIVNYRTPGLVVDALASIEAELDPGRDVALVIENDSGDDSAARIAAAIESRGWSRWARMIHSPCNGGFAAGNNLGLQDVEAPYYLLLNSDAYLRPGAIDSLLSAAEQHPEAGLVSPRLEWPDGEPQISCFRFHTPASELIGAAGTGPVTRILKGYEVPLPVDSAPSWPEWTSFACVMIRRELIEMTGLMDEGYFMYFDDVDYCRRATSTGWRVLNWPEARVVHLRGGTSPVKAAMAARKRPPAYYYASRSRYFVKFYGQAGLWLANICWLLGRGIAGLRELVGNKRPHACESAWRDIWIGAASVDHQPAAVQGGEVSSRSESG
jgi:hypothetical protein